MGIGGPTRAGKTTLALSLQEFFPNSTIIHQDHYFKQFLPDVSCRNIDFQNWETPEALKFSKFLQMIVDTKQNMTKLCPTCQKKITLKSKETDHHGSQQHQKSETSQQTNNNSNPSYIFVEGFLIYTNVVPNYDYMKLFDLKFFLSIDRESCYQRRFHFVYYLSHSIKHTLHPYSHISIHKKFNFFSNCNICFFIFL